jgi:Integrase core domain
VRAECLDWTLVVGRRHLQWLLRGYVRHDNQQRPHRGLALAVPEPEAREQRPPQINSLEVRRREVLGGLIHEYHRSQHDESGFPRPTGGHLERVLRVYVKHYNEHRPHRALGKTPPLGPGEPPSSHRPAAVPRRDRLGGLIHEYAQVA